VEIRNTYYTAYINCNFCPNVRIFFLRLYKTSLDDIKYYQNEITNIESKWLALNAVMEDKDKTLLNIIVDYLSKTERNFILNLKKGDSTLGLERERLEKNEVIELVKDALSTASKIRTGK
jgi:pyrroloquinoline quinone (PQQ) biosynthesis protein C